MLLLIFRFLVYLLIFLFSQYLFDHIYLEELYSVLFFLLVGFAHLLIYQFVDQHFYFLSLLH